MKNHILDSRDESCVSNLVLVWTHSRHLHSLCYELAEKNKGSLKIYNCLRTLMQIHELNKNPERILKNMDKNLDLVPVTVTVFLSEHLLFNCLLRCHFTSFIITVITRKYPLPRVTKENLIIPQEHVLVYCITPWYNASELQAKAVLKTQSNISGCSRPQWK